MQDYDVTIHMLVTLPEGQGFPGFGDRFLFPCDMRYIDIRCEMCNDKRKKLSIEWPEINRGFMVQSNQWKES